MVVLYSLPKPLGPGVCFTKNDDMVDCLGSFVIGEWLMLEGGVGVIDFSTSPN